MRKKVWSRPSLLVVPLLLLLLVFFVLPYVNMLFMSFMTPSTISAYEATPTLENYRGVISDPFNWLVLLRTVLLATITTLVTLLIAYPLAYHLARASIRAKGVLIILIISPLLIGVIVRTYGWIVILADRGLINQTLSGWGLIDRPLPLMYNSFGVVIGLVHIYLPFMVLPLAGRLQLIAPELEMAARSLGGGAWRTFWRITWPLSLPGVQAGTIIVWILSCSAYVIPALLGGGKVITAPVLVVQTVLDQGNWPLGTAQATMLFLAMAIVIGLYVKLINRSVSKWA